MAMPRLGEGYHADHGNYRLFVEMELAGLSARVYDLSGRKWAFRAFVPDVDEGKRLAMQKLLDIVTPEERQKLLDSGLKWQHHGQKEP